MEKITVKIYRDEVYGEVAKATDYTGSKMIHEDEEARERILALDDDLTELGRFWDEAVQAVNENFKEMLVRGGTTEGLTVTEIVGNGKNIEGTPSGAPVTEVDYRLRYEGEFEVSKSFDKGLTASVESTLKSFFIASIIGQWFKFANKGESGEYFAQAAELIEAAERLLYSRRRPVLPKDV